MRYLLVDNSLEILQLTTNNQQLSTNNKQLTTNNQQLTDYALVVSG